MFGTHGECNTCDISYVRSGMGVVDLTLLAFTAKGHLPFLGRHFGPTYLLILRGINKFQVDHSIVNTNTCTTSTSQVKIY